MKGCRKYFYRFLIFVAVFGVASCTVSTKEKRFELPVEAVMKLDSTEIGFTTILSNLHVPWELAWGPDDQIWFTEQSGTVSKVDPHTGIKKQMLDITSKVHRHRTMGLLGLAIHSLKDQVFVVLNYTTYTADSVLVSRLERYSYTRDTLSKPKILLEVPGGKGGHNGSRVIISKRGEIFWATGDIGRAENAQDTTSLNGKILRLNIDGSIPDDNPFPESPVWSIGHRNIQGLSMTAGGHLFSSEHGEATDDEVNLISKGRNYGWPYVEGFCDTPSEKLFCDSVPVTEPLTAWTPCIAPSGMEYYHSEKIPEWKNALLLLTLKGVSMHILHLNRGFNKITLQKIQFENTFGRLRDICVSPSGDVYVSTSNRDWNPLGIPAENDDRIIRIAKISRQDNLQYVNKEGQEKQASEHVAKTTSAGEKLYVDYCSSCHKTDGNGVADIFPALRNNKYVKGDKSFLAKILLEGSAVLPSAKSSGNAGTEKMASFNFLNDEQIAGILTYIRQNFGDHPNEVTSAAEIEFIRKQLK